MDDSRVCFVASKLFGFSKNVFTIFEVVCHE